MTPKQKDLIRWIVMEVNSERLPEAGIRFNFPNNGLPTIDNYEGDKDQIPVKSLSTEVIAMFEGSKYMKVRRVGYGSHEIHECTLMIDAYSAAEIESQHFFPQGATHDAYVKIKEILRYANLSVTIVDPYIDESIFLMIASLEQPKLSVKLLTSKVPPDFALEAAKFTNQHSAIALEVRKTKEFHDRFIILDGRQFYHVGASIKDAGNKVFMISLVQDQQNVNALLREYERSWNAASPLAS